MADIVEVWADTSRVVEREFTAEEAAQREADIAKFEAEKAKNEADAIAAEEARIAALAHARSLGFTDNMIKVMYPSLIVE